MLVSAFNLKSSVRQGFEDTACRRSLRVNIPLYFESGHVTYPEDYENL